MKGKLKALEQNYNPWDGVDLSSWEDCKASVPGKIIIKTKMKSDFNMRLKP